LILIWGDLAFPSAFSAQDQFGESETRAPADSQTYFEKALRLVEEYFCFGKDLNMIYDRSLEVK